MSVEGDGGVRLELFSVKSGENTDVVGGSIS